jgi:UDP-N-acetylmuramoyl-tripeptide--D-alanyl-D-alanine ligase
VNYTLGEIARITGGKLIQGDPASRLSGVAIDSRKDVSGALFCAIQGQRADGHDFLDVVAAKGAVGALVQRPVATANPAFGLILTESTVKALGDLAAFHRSRLPVTVIGITGSVGKTSTKDLIGAVLNRRFTAYKNPGNLNSHIGLPLAILGMEPGYEYAVLEMAMRARGEIKELCGIAKPKIGVLTDISASHIGVLGNLEEISLAKRELLESLPQDGLAVLCHDNELVLEAGNHARCRKVTYGFSPDADCSGYHVRPSDTGHTDFKVNYKGRRFGFRLGVPGVHQVQNALAAIAIGFELGLSADEIAQGLAEVALSPMRLEVVKGKRITIINDAYNASVKSMTAALDLLESVGGGRKIAILGDMLEMGEYGPAAHLEVGRYARNKADVLVAIGPLSSYIKQGWDEAATTQDDLSSWFPDKQSATGLLCELIRPGDTYLVKASRSLEFEGLVDFLSDLDNRLTGDDPC